MSGMKTYVGKDIEEIYSSLDTIDTSLGLPNEFEAKSRIEEVKKYIKNTGIMATKIDVVSCNKKRGT